MLSFFKKLISYLRQYEPIYESTFLILPQLDPEVIKKKLRLDEAAIERGTNNLPPTQSKSLDDNEQRIVAYMQDRVRDASEHYFAYQRAFDDNITRLKAHGHIERLDGIADATESDFDQCVRQGETDIYVPKTNVREILDYIKKFKDTNKLDRPAIYPKSKYLHIAIIFILVIAETCINSYFFAKGSALGYIGGFSIAFIPSVLNVIGAFIIGNYALRLLSHIKKTKYVFGIILTITFAAIILIINLLLAHYRTTMSLGFEDMEAAKQALINMRIAPFTLGDIESWLLFIAGIFFSLIASIDFLSMDDKYPGYGKVYRDKVERVDDYNNIIACGFDDLADIRDQRLEELKEVNDKVTSRYGLARATLENQNKWVKLYNEYFDHLENVGRILIGSYRAKNSSSRSSEPPKYFLKEWSLIRKESYASINSRESVLDDFKDDSKGNREIYANCIKRINDAYDLAFNKLKTIDDIKDEE